MESCLEVKIPSFELSFFALYCKTITRNLSESIKAFNSENIDQVCLVSSKTHEANKEFSNTIKDALSEFRVIVFWYRSKNNNSKFPSKYFF